ncbi:helix-turn-helix domain-containing protein [Halobacillus sp. BBL2006]|uniref:helix-turn-helix domain-containing protein n=1 Tax=Halobacillus sp. BBL2006 TaxID=1543706 RepID=UPI0005433401|nr:helix-turn-helix domain-containing protein [Halobacillus sp. BBL2006]KHE66938.1 hypothetical protein LD39_20130 [Halobacillus sp. BBL2006]
MTSLFDTYSPKIMTSPHTNYCEYRPHPFLEPYVCCYWSSEPKAIIDDPNCTSTIIPDGCTDIIIEYNKLSEECDILHCGIFEDYFTFKEDPYSVKKSFGIRFYPGKFTAFVSHNAKEAAQRLTGLEDINPSLTRKLREAFYASPNVYELIQTCDRILISVLKSDVRMIRNESRLDNLLFRILSSSGMAAVSDLSEKEVIGKRRIQRLFDQHIGMSPKKFSQVIRFQSVLCEWIDRSSSSRLKQPDHLDFYDQSHFSKDIKKRIGVTPYSLKVSDFYNTEEQTNGTI